SFEVARRLLDEFPTMRIVVPGGTTSRESEPLPGALTRIPVRPDLLPIAMAIALPMIMRFRGADVSWHAHWQTAGAAIIARTLTGRPRRIVVAVHGRELRHPSHRVSDRIRPRILEKVDHFLPVSRYTARLLEQQGVDVARMTIVGNGTDPERF